MHTRKNNNAARIEPFTFLNSDELLALPAENIPWLVDGLLPGKGMSCLAAKPKAGKSTLARQLAVAVAQGQSFLGRKTQQAPVCYLALEEKASEVAHHFRTLGLRPDDPLRTLCGAISRKGAIERLAHSIEPDSLLVVDPLFKLLRVADGNDYREMSDALEELLSLARAKAHILLVHRLKKREAEFAPDGLLGSQALAASTDTNLILRADRRGNRTLCTSQRYGTDLPETFLEWDSAVRRVRQHCRGRARAKRTAHMPEDSRRSVELRSGKSRLQSGNDSTQRQRKTATVLGAIQALIERGEILQSGLGVKGNPVT